MSKSSSRRSRRSYAQAASASKQQPNTGGTSGGPTHIQAIPTGMAASSQKGFAGIDGDAGWSSYGGGSNGLFGPGGSGQLNIGISRFRNTAEQLGAYAADDTVHACCKVRAKAIARLKWRLRHIKTGTVIEEASHASMDEVARTTALFRDPWELKKFQELTALLRRPNPYQTWFDFMALQQMYYDLAGNALSLKDNPNEMGWPEHLWPLNPAWTQPIIDPQEGLIGYYYQSGTTQLAAEPEYISHAKEVSPASLFWGMSVIQVAAGILDAQVGIDEYQRGFFANGAVMSGLVLAPESVKPQEFKLLKSEIKEQFQGVRNHFKIGLLQGGMTWQNTSLSQIDMGMIDWKKLGQSRVRQLYGVPQSKLGDQDDAQYNKLDAADRTFYKETITPLAEMWQRQLTNDITSWYGYELEFDVPQYEDVASLMGIVKQIDDIRSLTIWEKRQTIKKVANRHVVLEDDPDAPMTPGLLEESQPTLHYIFGPDGVTPIAQLSDDRNGGKRFKYLPSGR